MIALQRAALAGRIRAFDAKTVAWKPPAEVVPEPVAAPVVSPEPDPVPEPAPLVLPHASHWLPVRMPPKRYPSVEDIQLAVIRGTKVTLHDLKTSVTRFGPIPLHRQIAMYLAVEFISKSWNQIGREFNRDHTTIIHAVRKISHCMDICPAFAETVDLIRSAIEKDAP